jgi:hypothetical protein
MMTETWIILALMLSACTLPAPQSTSATRRATLEWLQRQQHQADQRYENFQQRNYRQWQWRPDTMRRP